MTLPTPSLVSMRAAGLLYICGPMTGYTDYNYPAFNATDDQLQAVGFDTLNPVHNDPGEGETNGLVKPAPSWSWFMRQSLKQIAECDGIAVLDGWEGSRGARLEVSIASTLEIPCAPVSHWLHVARQVHIERNKAGVTGPFKMGRR